MEKGKAMAQMLELGAQKTITSCGLDSNLAHNLKSFIDLVCNTDLHVV